jgi:hypothetical protein
VLLWVTSLQQLLDAVFGWLDWEHEPLRPFVRAVDATCAELVATAAPLRSTTVGRQRRPLRAVLRPRHTQLDGALARLAANLEMRVGTTTPPPGANRMTAIGATARPMAAPMPCRHWSTQHAVSRTRPGRRSDVDAGAHADRAVRQMKRRGDQPPVLHRSPGLRSAGWSPLPRPVVASSKSRPAHRDETSRHSPGGAPSRATSMTLEEPAPTCPANRKRRVPAGTTARVAVTVTTLVPGTASVGTYRSHPLHTDGTVGSRNRGVPHGRPKSLPRTPVHSGARRRSGTQRRAEMGAVMLRPGLSAVG